jgi:hypothetical protein
MILINSLTARRPPVPPLARSPKNRWRRPRGGGVVQIPVSLSLASGTPLSPPLANVVRGAPRPLYSVASTFSLHCSSEVNLSSTVSTGFGPSPW